VGPSPLLAEEIQEKSKFVREILKESKPRTNQRTHGTVLEQQWCCWCVGLGTFTSSQHNIIRLTAYRIFIRLSDIHSCEEVATLHPITHFTFGLTAHKISKPI
jgi:hypothetical protein